MIILRRQIQQRVEFDGCLFGWSRIPQLKKDDRLFLEVN
jgi:hypothetical protein